MELVGSANAAVGMDAAWEALVAGASAVEAVECCVRLVEDNLDDHTVGFNSYPNLIGELELDAAIMDGRSREAGAVGALQGYRHPISVARAIMDRLPHVMLVGQGAGRFAAEIGEKACELLTDEARDVWQAGLEGRAPLGEAAALLLEQVNHMAPDPRHSVGTVNVLARDSEGRLAAAVSTSGWAWKYPGRLGDTPVIGAGIYADDRAGAAGCTGFGELALRAQTASSVVAALRSGSTVEQACRIAMKDISELPQPLLAEMNIVCLDHQGNAIGVSATPDHDYVLRTETMNAYQRLPRLVIPLAPAAPLV